ncbi:FtsW/RodA/SpoVE family cell cycle protein [Pedobacter sp.]|uniref:FtsW/RodA/SpoVE family cell cycle protein n=1 Tax=Pedobacter sp. TaxID=1411316 RepID=UPI003D7FE3DB
MINQQGNSSRFFFNVDWVTILIYMALCTIGYVNIYSSVYNPDLSDVYDFGSNYGKQFIFIVTGLILGFSILLLDAKFFSVFSPIVYGITMLLLIAVLVVGRKIAGNQAWIPIGSFRLQPSEFAKFGTALLLARYVGTFSPKFKDFKSILFAALIVALPLFFIMMQETRKTTFATPVKLPFLLNLVVCSATEKSTSA